MDQAGLDVASGGHPGSTGSTASTGSTGSARGQARLQDLLNAVTDDLVTPS